MVIVFFLYGCSSGTSEGKPKLIPFSEEYIESVVQIHRTSFAFRNR